MLSCFCPYRRPHVTPSLHISLYLIHVFHIPAIPDVTEELALLSFSLPPLILSPHLLPFILRASPLFACQQYRAAYQLAEDSLQPLSYHHSAISRMHLRLGSSIHMYYYSLTVDGVNVSPFWSVSLQNLAAC